MTSEQDVPTFGIASFQGSKVVAVLSESRSLFQVPRSEIARMRACSSASMITQELNRYNLTPTFDFETLILEHLNSALDIDNMIRVFAHLLLEKKVLLVSDQYSALTPVAEFLLSLLAPLDWCGQFIPVLSNQILGAINSPTCGLFGIHREYYGQLDSSDASVVCAMLAWTTARLVQPKICHCPTPLNNSW
jgi:hypothetical protein